MYPIYIDKRPSTSSATEHNRTFFNQYRLHNSNTFLQHCTVIVIARPNGLYHNQHVSYKPISYSSRTPLHDLQNYGTTDKIGISMKYQFVLNFFSHLQLFLSSIKWFVIHVQLHRKSSFNSSLYILCYAILMTRY